MRARRGVIAPRALCSGPGKLCQALAIDGGLTGASVLAPPFELSPAAPSTDILQGRRIGISVGVETPWRFARAGSPFLSRPMEP
jgi:DNA-3-methyladenine glycosylase